ncbi:hypothetical protein BJX63DRAFT_433239 [Aspergillus granulosus]|uniref:Uncharacterized protein n=1 Tax=Aspergillus granulosus TaxID=176169 RepID=A0ABR4H837_9EURO
MTKLDKLLGSPSTLSVVTAPQLLEVESHCTPGLTASASLSPSHTQESSSPDSIKCKSVSCIPYFDRYPSFDNPTPTSAYGGWEFSGTNPGAFTPLISIPPELYPVSMPYDISLLLNHFSEYVAFTAFPSDPNTIAYYLDTLTEDCLLEPCIFYAILYAASSHLDTHSGQPTALTLWFETEILRLLQARLNGIQTAGNNVARNTIALLALFTPFSMNPQSSATHIRALLAIKQAVEYFIYAEYESVHENIIHLASMTFNMIFDSRAGTGPNPTLTLPTDPRGILLAAMRQCLMAPATTDYGHGAATFATLQDIYNAITLLLMVQEGTVKEETVYWIIRKGRLQAQYRLGATEHDWVGPAAQESQIGTANHVNSACRLAASITWITLDEKCSGSISLREEPPRPREPLVSLDCIVQNLKTTVAAVGVEIWLRTAPLLYTWVSLTGAAVTEDMALRAWFSLQHCHAMFVSGDIRLLQESWSYFGWFRELNNGSPWLG